MTQETKDALVAMLSELSSELIEVGRRCGSPTQRRGLDIAVDRIHARRQNVLWTKVLTDPSAETAGAAPEA
jgi:hypothetical protein